MIPELYCFRLFFDTLVLGASLEYPVVIVPTFQPIALGRAPAAFSHPDWMFEIKFDGFRALAQIEQGHCSLVSRNGNAFKSFRSLAESLASEVKHSVVLDGEIVCLDDDGKPRFDDLLFRRGEPRFVAFDLLHCDGQDLKYSPLIERKQKLRAVLPSDSRSVLFCDHIEAYGEALFKLACENDLEGTVAKYKFAPYLQEHARWLKIRNRSYSQWKGREKFFERERESDPDIALWRECVLACEDGT
jgi:bifunctional non-homologous end joining protein LigD